MVTDEILKPKLVNERSNDTTEDVDLHELELDFEVEIEPFNIESGIGTNNFNKDRYYEKDSGSIDTFTENFIN